MGCIVGSLFGVILALLKKILGCVFWWYLRSGSSCYDLQVAVVFCVFLPEGVGCVLFRFPVVLF